MAMRILIIDDDPLVRSLLRGLLARKGHDVVEYQTPAACPLYTAAGCPCGLTGHCPDAILTDLSMPLATGLDFIVEQRRKGCRCRHVALMSGSWTDDDLRQVRRLGVTLLAKPFDFDRLQRWIATTAADTAAAPPAAACACL